MRRLLLVAVIAGGAWQYFNHLAPQGTLQVLMQVPETAAGAGGIHQARAAVNGFSVDGLAAPRAITIVEFYTDSCTGCQRLHQHYKRFLAVRPDVVVRQVHMPDNWNIDWARQRFHQEIGSTPHILIYGADGQLLAGDAGLQKAGFDLLYEWMNAELKKEFKREHRG